MTEIFRALILSFILISNLAASQNLLGGNANQNSNYDLKNRIEKLESTVMELQRQISELKEEHSIREEATSAWLCVSEGFSGKYPGSGKTKALARQRALDKCKSTDTAGFGTHCKEPKCEH